MSSKEVMTRVLIVAYVQSGLEQIVIFRNAENVPDLLASLLRRVTGGRYRATQKSS
jgi:hypothetical protein